MHTSVFNDGATVRNSAKRSIEQFDSAAFRGKDDETVVFIKYVLEFAVLLLTLKDARVLTSSINVPGFEMIYCS